MGLGVLLEKLASPQQAPGRLHEETWAGLLQKHCLRISQDVEIVPGCGALVACPSCLDNLLCHLGQAEEFGTCWAGHSWTKQ